MLKIKKLVNMIGEEIFYIATDNGAIEISLKNHGDFCWNYLGASDRYSRGEVSLTINKNDNECIYYLFDELYNNIINYYELVENRKSKTKVVGINAFDVVDEEKKICCFSDDVILANANKLSIEPGEDTYVITFTKGKNLDGYYNRNFRIKIKGFDSRNEPFNSCFREFYDMLLCLDEVPKNDQNAYTLSKKRHLAMNTL